MRFLRDGYSDGTSQNGYWRTFADVDRIEVLKAQVSGACMVQANLEAPSMSSPKCLDAPSSAPN